VAGRGNEMMIEQDDLFVCVLCGVNYVPEGSLVCPACMARFKDDSTERAKGVTK
jgi:rubrerythrin